MKTAFEPSAFPPNFHHPLKCGSVTIPGNLWLAPMAGYTDIPFRALCVKGGAALTTSEMISAEGLLRDQAKTFELTNRDESEKHYCIQIFASNPDSASKAVKAASALKPELLDLNCGCPVPKVVKQGCGSALIRDPKLLASIVRAMKDSTDIPVTVKIRSGWDDASLNYLVTATEAQKAGADALTLHPRTRAQGYSGKSNWDHLKELKEALSIPVIGSGDLFSPQDVLAMFQQTNVDGIMFARGSVGHPYIFLQTAALLDNGSYRPATLGQRWDAALEHLLLCVRFYGEAAACRLMRKHFSAYFKGVPNASRIRAGIIQALTVEEYRRLRNETEMEACQDD